MATRDHYRPMENEDDKLEVTIQKKTGMFTSENIIIPGRFSFYEETHDGTGSGWYKFKKDVASASKYGEGDSFEIEAECNGQRSKITNSVTLDRVLQSIKISKKLHIRVCKTGTSTATYTGIGLGIVAVAALVMLVAGKPRLLHS